MGRTSSFYLGVIFFIIGKSIVVFCRVGVRQLNGWLFTTGGNNKIENVDHRFCIFRFHCDRIFVLSAQDERQQFVPEVGLKIVFGTPGQCREAG